MIPVLFKTFETSYPIARLTSIQSTGHVPLYIECPSVEALIQACHDYPAHYLIGGGSNTILDPDNKTPIVRLTESSIEKIAPNRLYISAGTPIAKALRQCTDWGLSGLEMAAGVPACLGGMVAMNFGCWGNSIAKWVHRVHYLDALNQPAWRSMTDCEFTYRSSWFKQNNRPILGAEFTLTQSDPSLIRTTIAAAVERRRTAQPLRDKTYGSMFLNPPQGSAAQLIDTNQLKGYQIGGAKVSCMHANFMVNVGHASFQDIRALLSFIQGTVQINNHITLEPEVCQAL
tara:strand:- start:192 stop:1052 length:861 start_codon:yes stop_codon:yes gene_type:complete